MNVISSFLNKDWDIYTFVSPIFTLILSIYIVPIYSKLFSENLKRFLISHKMGDKQTIIDGISKDRGLQTAYVTGIPSFILSLIVTLRSSNRAIPLIILFIVLIIVVPILPHVFLKEPGSNDITVPQGNGIISRILRKRKWTYLYLYSRILALLNILLIIAIVIALPQKHSPFDF